MGRKRRARRSSSSVMRAMFSAEPAAMRRSVENRALAAGIEAEDPADAVRFVDDALRRFGPGTIGPEILAYVYGFGGRTEEAFELIEGARAQDPENKMMLVVHAGLLHRHDRLDECVAVLREALAAHPDEAGFHASLAWYGVETISRRALEFHVARALELDPQGHSPHIAGYYAAKHLGDQAKADEHREFLRLNHPEAHENLTVTDEDEAGEPESDRENP